VLETQWCHIQEFEREWEGRVDSITVLVACLRTIDIHPSVACLWVDVVGMSGWDQDIKLDTFDIMIVAMVFRLVTTRVLVNQELLQFNKMRFSDLHLSEKNPLEFLLFFPGL